ncbi:putative Ig domain-containing protein, partial [Nostoc sp. KVJ20]|uniref:putative Ig domain-containing protein n=1 Tax=Nostoc sp. KVJ20 TaxID=457944 RepID=UPI000B0FF524
AGDDSLYGEAGNDTLVGGDGSDRLEGGAQADYLRGEAGSDTIYGDNGDDIIFGGYENQSISYGDHDSIFGGEGNDTINPGWGNDVVDGNDGTDLLVIDYSTLPTMAVAWSEPDPGTNKYYGYVANAYGMGNLIKTDLDVFGTYQVAISADGTTIAGLSMGSNVYIKKIHTSEPFVQLAENTGYGFPQLSEDGSKVVWFNSSSIWIASTDGKQIRQLFSENYYEHLYLDAAISDDGSTIAWIDRVKKEYGFDYVIKSANADGSNLREITTDKNHHLQYVNLSSDGSKVTWSGSQTGVWVANTDGSNQRELSGNYGYNIKPAISADGSRVVWAGYAGAGYSSPGVYVANTDGSRLWTVPNTKNVSAFTSQSLSGDGSRVIFSQYISSDNQQAIYGLYVASVDGLEPLILIDTNTNNWDYGGSVGRGPTLSSYVDIGVRYNSFDLTIGSGEILTWGPSRVQFSNIERFDITGTKYGDDLFGGNLDDKLTGAGGADTLKAGLGNDTYILNPQNAGGSQIEDANGTDILELTGVTLSLNVPATEILGIRRAGTTLLIDLNQDGIAVTEDDLSIINFFDVTGTGAGTGFIETVTNLSGANILSQLQISNDTISGGNGDDFIDGGQGNDRLNGSKGNDTLRGEDGNDILLGEDGNDSLQGGIGNDTLTPGWGDDRADGGAGIDILVLNYSTLPTRAVAWSKVYNQTGFRSDFFIGNAYGLGSPIKIGENYQKHALSADGTTYAYYSNSNNGLWVKKLDSSNAPLKINDGYINTIAFSANGSKIAWSVGSQLYVANTDGTGKTEISRSNSIQGDIYFLSFASSGNQVAWTANAKLFVVNTDGTNLRQITQDSSDSPYLSADGSQIIWRGYQNNNSQYGIWWANTNSNFPQINSLQLGNNAFYSSNGTTALWSDSSSSLSAISTNSSEIQEVAESYGLRVNGGANPVLASDGQKAAFVKPLDTNYQGYGLYGLYIADTYRTGTATLIDTAIENGSTERGFGTDKLAITSYVNIGVRYNSFDLATGSGEISTWGPSHVRFSNVERFDITGTIYGDDLRGGNLNDKLTGGGGADSLKGGLGDDVYILQAQTAAGSQIEDTGGTDTLDLADITLSLSTPVAGITGIQRIGTTLLIDLNQDGITTPEADLSVLNFFNSNATGAGVGFIETLDNLSGINVLNKLLGISVNQAPLTQGNKTLTILEDAAPTYLALATPTDADNDPLTITVTAVPEITKGEIRLSNNTVVTANTTLTTQQLTNLVFVPISNANGNIGTFSYTVTDGNGGTASQTITLEITGVNDLPIINQALADQITTADKAFSFTIPANTFNDIDVSDILTYLATLENGNALPSWLTFNAETRTFSGNPTNNNFGSINIKVTASDGTASISDVFVLTVANTIIQLPNVINGTSGADNLTGTLNKDIISGLLGNDTLQGLGDNDTLDSGDGNDSLDGGTGDDSLIGGKGNDTYILDSISDTIIESASAGTDLVKSSVSWVLGANLENLTLTGSLAINATGNSLNNIITGNTAANILNGVDGNDSLIGGDGNDTLLGGAGNDTLDGGLGADSLNGGIGNDTYIVDNFNDTITEGLNAGTDLVKSSVSFLLADNLEKLTLTGSLAINGTGNKENNILIGNTAANTLNGVDGNDSLIGGSGNDTLIGGSGNDTLDGGVGNDSLDGGAGNDIYTVDSLSDTITEGLNAGTDLVKSSVSWVLTDNLENLTLTGSKVINGTGNSLDNIITGNSAANTFNGVDGNDSLIGGSGNDTLFGGVGDDDLDGGAGNDSLDGGVGNDTYTVNSVSDTVTEGLNAGTDLVKSSITWVLGNNLENLTLSRSSAINGTGNSLDNILTGNTGANILNGVDGNDRLFGNSGNDTLLGGAGDDLLAGGVGRDILTGGVDRDSFNLANTRTGGYDTITDFSVGDDTIFVSKTEFGLSQSQDTVLDSSLFRLGTNATIAGDRFIYDQTTGNLFFDKDGIGSAARVQIAQFSNQVALTSANITVIA